MTTTYSLQLTLGFTGTDETRSIKISPIDVTQSSSSQIKARIAAFNSGGATTKAAVGLINPDDTTSPFMLSEIIEAKAIVVEEEELA